MARFERSRSGNRDSRGGSSRRGFEDSSRRGSGRDRDSSRGGFGRESKRNSRNRRDFEMTKVTCSSCGVECEVPFKPTSDKPLYCRDCFSKTNKGSSNKTSNRDLDVINEKLNKIMKALKIE